MPKEFSDNERRLCSYFKRGVEFKYNSLDFVVSRDAGKPTCSLGEPKTDVYFEAVNNEGKSVDFKISYKQDNADFLENKTSVERAEHLLGENWSSIVVNCSKDIRQQFEDRYLIYKDKFKRTDEGAFTLGWKFELLRVKSGELSGKIDLSYEQKYDVYAGTSLTGDKRNANVDGEIIKNSGVADYLFEETVHANNAQDVMDNLRTITEYLEEYPNVYYACKALNYRSFIPKYDGNRPLAVFVDWFVKDGKLDYNIVYDKPLIIKGNSVASRLMNALDNLRITDTRQINHSNVKDYTIVYEKRG